MLIHKASHFPPAHGYVTTRPVAGSIYPTDYTFVLTQDELYVPIAVRKPSGTGPFPAILMGRGNGRGGMPLIEQKLALYHHFQECLLRRGYVVVYVNYRHEIPHYYGVRPQTPSVEAHLSGESLTLQATPRVDSDDLQSVIHYIQTLPYVRAQSVGVMGVSHGGETLLKAAAEMNFGCGVVIEGASHEFLSVHTGPEIARIDGEIQFQDIAVVKKWTNKARALSRLRAIHTPMLHIGRDKDHLQGIFKLVHEWMSELGKDSQWVSFDHPTHGYSFIETDEKGQFNPDPMQQKCLDLILNYLDHHLG
jgi:dienelactone hydrolase